MSLLKTLGTIFLSIFFVAALMASTLGEGLSTVKSKKLPSSAIAIKSNRSKKTLRKSIHLWLKKMKKRVARARAKHNKLVAVASVRGSEKSDPPPLYWKGKPAGGPIDITEVDEFDDILTIALEGNTPGSIEKLESFVKNHPNSPLAPEARETISVLSKRN